MKVVNTEKDLTWQTQYDNWATPMAAVELLRWFQLAIEHDQGRRIDFDRIPAIDPVELAESWDLIYIFMARSATGTNRLRGLLPESLTVAHKTGTGGTQNGSTSATNDIGIFDTGRGKHVAIAVFVSDSTANEPTREAVIAKIAKAAWDKWSR